MGFDKFLPHPALPKKSSLLAVLSLLYMRKINSGFPTEAIWESLDSDDLCFSFQFPTSSTKDIFI